MFNLSRYFSTLSFVLIVLAAGMLGALYRELSLHHIEELAENRNVEMAQVFRNSLQSRLDALMRDTAGRDAEYLRNSGDARRLLDDARALMRDTAVIKIKIYNRSGNTVFSTDPAQIGEDRQANPGFQRAIAGRVASELTYRNRIDAFEGVRSDVHVLSSYVPIAARDHRVEGVFELYQDVTPFVGELRRGLWQVTLGVFVVFAVLYLMQFLVVRRAQGILREQERRIEAARDTLEIQVAARTDELKGANLRLEAEISERRQAQEELNYLAYHDPLTGLANRSYFIERLEQAMREVAAGDGHIALLFIDLDQFKQVNDSLGHGVGDELLVAVSSRLLEHVSPGDMLARLGGDEFVCLMAAADDAGNVSRLADEILAAFETPYRIGELELFQTASIGICLHPGDGASVGDLLRNADTAMYRAKAAGRCGYSYYTPEMTRQARERIRMENLLRRALDKEELTVHLQAQVDAATGRLAGAEALARWRSPELGTVDPTRFIALAEDSGLIVSLGHWVLGETCRQVMRWQRQGFALPQVSVNLSVRQLERPGFLAALAGILRETGMPPSSLKLELTESAVMAVDNAFALLQQIREMGIGLSIDDFGTGYSSLSYLKRLPVQQLKIDKSFVDGIGANTGDEAIIRTIMELARSLGFEVVAEGVETQAQADFLASLGCPLLQGNLHGKAMAPEAFLACWSASS